MESSRVCRIIMIKIFEQSYSGEEICDVDRDIYESLTANFNPVMDQIPCDEHNIHEGIFKVTITWESDNE